MKIKSIKKTSNKYKIELENNEKITTYDDVILKNNILYKKEIDKELIKKIEEENIYYDAYNKVVKYINKKLRIESEIKKYLKQLEIDKNLEEKIIEKLKQTKLINDELYAHAYIHDKITLTNDGPNKIKKELLQQIEEKIIDDELEKIDYEEIHSKIEKIIEKKIKNNTKYSENMLKQKIINEMIIMGYDKNKINETLDNKILNNTNIIKKEYIKIYNKLKQKYSGEELNFKIKQKLYQKGFNLEEINEIIN